MTLARCPAPGTGLQLTSENPMSHAQREHMAKAWTEYIYMVAACITLACMHALANRVLQTGTSMHVLPDDCRLLKGSESAHAAGPVATSA